MDHCCCRKKCSHGKYLRKSINNKEDMIISITQGSLLAIHLLVLVQLNGANTADFDALYNFLIITLYCKIYSIQYSSS